MSSIEEIENILSDQQRAALGLAGQGLISAGAGAGKTQTMAALVCRDILVDGIAPEEILVCTFTRAAAANLVNRISSNLTAIAGERHVDLTTMWVGTIDSLSSRLLRQGSLTIGISPGFTVADERLLWPMQRQAIEQAIDNLSDEHLFYLAEVGDIESLRLPQHLIRIADDVRSLGKDSLDVVEPQATDFNELIAEIDELLADLPPLTDKQNENLRDKLEQDRQALLDRDLDGFSSRKYGRPAQGKEEFWQRAQALQIDWARNELFAEVNYPVRRAVALAVNDYIARMNQVKSEQELVDLIDVANLARQLLASGYLPKIKRLYIDEAQDTNPQQLAILDALASGDQIAVGDSNQSIYGFRSADIEAFRSQKRSSTSSVELSENYRSQPKILDFVNVVGALCPELADELVAMRIPEDSANQNGGGEVEVVVVADEDETPTVEEEASGVWPEVDNMRRRLGLNYSDVAILCRSNSEASGYADVLRASGVPTLLIQKRGLAAREECRDLIAFLSLIDDYDDEAALVRVLTSPFVALDDSQLMEIFTSRSEERSLFEQVGQLLPEFAERYWLLRNRSLRPSQLAAEAIHLYGVDLTLDSLDNTGALRRNVEKLIDSISEVEAALDGSSLKAVLLRFRAEEEAGIDEGQDSRLPEGLDAVRVMTIHQAKGDEFPLTVFARISKRVQSHSSSLLIDRQGNLGCGYQGKKDNILAAEQERRDRVSSEEERRLVYVAMTRAEQGLVLAASCKINKDGGGSWQGVARWLFKDILPFYEPPGGDEERHVLRAMHHDQSLTADFIARRVEAQVIGTLADRRPLLDLPLAEERAFRLPSQASPLSYTSLSNWGRCGLRRHLERDLGLEFKRNLVKNKAGRGARSFGIQVHETLAAFDWNDLSALPGLSSDHDEREMLNNLARSDLAKRLAKSQILLREGDFTLAIGTYILQGTIDLLARDDQGLFMVDWKTGSESERFAGEYALQRRLYAGAVLCSDYGSEVEAIWYSLTDGQATHERFDDASLAKIQQEMNEILTQPIVPATEVFEPFCVDCPGLQQVCPVSQAELLEQDD